ncbi:MAG TPA: CopG family antitoxin [Candidatus Kapabacteria bacterium]|nr:CopG family antitoxin [Candidatus Kapabacteria bacterium]
MNKYIKPLPDFKSEEEEFEFWATHDSTDYFDLSKAEAIRKKNAFPNLKRTETKVEVALPPDLEERLKARAKNENVPIEFLLQRYVREGIERRP